MGSRKYIGPPCGALILPDGYKVTDPANLSGQALDDEISRHPDLARYYSEPAKERKSAKEDRPKPPPADSEPIEAEEQ